MKEIYDIIITKLERDKLNFSKEVMTYIDDVEFDDCKKIGYERAHAKRQYCDELIDFFKEVRDKL